MLHNSFQVLKCHITTIIIRMINNSATHATTDIVAIVRAEQKSNIIAQKHIFPKFLGFFYWTIVPEQQTIHK